MPIYLRFDQYQIDKQHYEIVLDVFVGEFLAHGALGEAYAFAKGSIVGFGVGRVECAHGGAAGYAYGHGCGMERGRARWDGELL
jgi:hypothetical protein